MRHENDQFCKTQSEQKMKKKNPQIQMDSNKTHVFSFIEIMNNQLKCKGNILLTNNITLMSIRWRQRAFALLLVRRIDIK